MKNPLTLIIMDGFGISEPSDINAVSLADTHNLDRIFSENPYTTLSCSGEDVGLPEGQMGNSEVGHANIGAGRVVYQELTRITKAIRDGDFFKNPALCQAMDCVLEHGTALHLFGLLSEGGVHSHVSHLYALLKMAKDRGLSKVYIHCFMDGRDVPPESGIDSVRECVAKTREIGIGKIATVMGRYYAMDRDNRWERVEKAYAAMVCREAAHVNLDPVAAMRASYDAGITDEFIEPVVCLENGEGAISELDSVIFFNFRGDRAREITRTFVDDAFSAFERRKGFLPLHYVCFTEYDAAMPNVKVAFLPETLKNTFAEYISALGFTQLRIAETEKYAHVTFFFNGGVETVYKGEDRVLIPSPRVATYDLKPEMSACEVTDEAVARIGSGKYDVVILNFANCDMVGHTGVLPAAVSAVQVIDACVGRIVRKTAETGGMTIITADHGNADRMVDDDGATPYTAHTTSAVPFCIVGAEGVLKKGRLCDIAPTMLDLMGLAKPDEMTGASLIG